MPEWLLYNYYTTKYFCRPAARIHKERPSFHNESEMGTEYFGTNFAQGIRPLA
jgi:hypothetical protein